MAQLRVLEAALVVRRRQREEGGVATGELIDRWSSQSLPRSLPDPANWRCTCRSCESTTCPSRWTVTGPDQARTLTILSASEDARCTRGCLRLATGGRCLAKKAATRAWTTRSLPLVTPASAPPSWVATCSARSVDRGGMSGGPAGGATDSRTTTRCLA